MIRLNKEVGSVRSPPSPSSLTNGKSRSFSRAKPDGTEAKQAEAWSSPLTVQVVVFHCSIVKRSRTKRKHRVFSASSSFRSERGAKIEKLKCFYIYMRLDLIKKIARLRAELVLLAFSYRRDAPFWGLLPKKRRSSRWASVLAVVTAVPLAYGDSILGHSQGLRIVLCRKFVVLPSPFSRVTSYLSWPRKISSRGIFRSYRFFSYSFLFLFLLWS